MRKSQVDLILDRELDMYLIFVFNETVNYEPEYPGVNKYPPYEFPIGRRDSLEGAIIVIESIMEQNTDKELEPITYTIIQV